ncbi:MAG: hypothetical protein R3275_02785 [Saprospiraceae bacterium]|nr:hypothetical protein [Saprospiraceae bacterium]
MKRPIILGIAVLIVVAGVIGFYQFNKKVPKLDSAQADYSVTADELYSEFNQNEKEALKKYQDKVIEVSGTVLRTKVDSTQFNIILKAEGSLTGGVNCALRDMDADPPSKGNQITLKGRCQGYLMDVVINNCVLVKG